MSFRHTHKKKHRSRKEITMYLMGSFKTTVGDYPRKTQAKETTLTGHAKRVKDDQKEAIPEKNHENAIL